MHTSPGGLVMSSTSGIHTCGTLLDGLAVHLFRDASDGFPLQGRSRRSNTESHTSGAPSAGAPHHSTQDLLVPSQRRCRRDGLRLARVTVPHEGCPSYPGAHHPPQKLLRAASSEPPPLGGLGLRRPRAPPPPGSGTTTSRSDALSPGSSQAAFAVASHTPRWHHHVGAPRSHPSRSKAPRQPTDDWSGNLASSQHQYRQRSSKPPRTVKIHNWLHPC